MVEPFETYVGPDTPWKWALSRGGDVLSDIIVPPDECMTYCLPHQHCGLQVHLPLQGATKHVNLDDRKGGYVAAMWPLSKLFRTLVFYWLLVVYW